MAVITEAQKAEVQKLYSALAKHWKWPMPQTWLGDRAAVVGDIDNALKCLRLLVADQCPIREVANEVPG